MDSVKDLVFIVLLCTYTCPCEEQTIQLFFIFVFILISLEKPSAAP